LFGFVGDAPPEADALLMTRIENVDASALLRVVAYIRVSMTRQGLISPELQMAAISEPL
jgi:hypothetical protein